MCCLQYLSPSPSISLIEKQLSIFLAASGSGSAGSSGDSVSVASAGRSVVANSSSGTMTWDTVLRFVVVVGVWFLQHSYIALTLLEEFELSPKELHAIRAL
jgi:hypothetical protein